MADILDVTFGKSRDAPRRRTATTEAQETWAPRRDADDKHDEAVQLSGKPRAQCCGEDR
jgi:hypothetical protein